MTILDELEVGGQLSRLPTRAWLGRMALIGFGSVWALLAVIALLADRPARLNSRFRDKNGVSCLARADAVETLFDKIGAGFE